MKQFIKLSVIICFLVVGTCIIAGTNSQATQINQSINTIALAKKDASLDKVVSLAGKLVKEGKKIYLQDSTGKIILEIPKKMLKTIEPMINKTVQVTGKTSNILWKNSIKVQSIEVTHTTNTSTDTGIKK